MAPGQVTVQLPGLSTLGDPSRLTPRLGETEPRTNLNPFRVGFSRRIEHIYLYTKMYVMCMYICVWNMYIYTYIHTYIHTTEYIHTDRQTDMHMCVRMCVCVCVCMSAFLANMSRTRSVWFLLTGAPFVFSAPFFSKKNHEPWEKKEETEIDRECGVDVWRHF